VTRLHRAWTALLDLCGILLIGLLLTITLIAHAVFGREND
jgi:hypothetical protein